MARVISPRPHQRLHLVQWYLEQYWPSKRSTDASVESDGGVDFFVTTPTPSPPRWPPGLCRHDRDEQGSEQYYYFPASAGTPAAELHFDTPLIGFENQYLVDEETGIWMTLDRYDWSWWEEGDVNIGANVFAMWDYKADPKVVFERFIQPLPPLRAAPRLGVDGRLKPGFRHLARTAPITSTRTAGTWRR